MMEIMGDSAETRRKRKLQGEVTGTPLPKQMSRRGYSSDCARRTESAIFAENEENSKEKRRSDTNCSILSRTDIEYPKSTPASNVASASFAASNEHEHLEFYPYFNREEETQEFGCSSLGANEDCKDKQLENLLYANGVTPSDYNLLSEIWPVNQDEQNRSEKLTIDQEFEQYFSSLML